jgi:sensor c-di-GMP phosphodiesterase-like protein
MTVLRWVARFFGWLLTPVVAWAASFLGATVTASLTRTIAGGTNQLIVTVVGGAVAAALALIGWLRLLRRSRRLRETLQVEPDGTPIAAVDPETSA